MGVDRDYQRAEDRCRDEQADRGGGEGVGGYRVDDATDELPRFAATTIVRPATSGILGRMVRFSTILALATALDGAGCSSDLCGGYKDACVGVTVGKILSCGL